ncbi:MAG TPA: M50 family metallopeptidase [Planktothrix sp.]
MLGEVFGYVIMLGILSILIIVHECGHFLVARSFGFQTPVFGIGLPFGPYKAVGRKWGTEFRIYAFLLGGFVAIPELGDESNADAFGVPLKPFHKFPIWQRALVAFAGVAFNILFAYLIMLCMFLFMGQPSQQTVVAGFPTEPTLAFKAGIKKDDIITKIDDAEIANSDDAVSYLGRHKATLVHINVLRDNKPVTVDVTTNENGKVGMMLTGKGAVTYRKVDGNFFQVAGVAAERLWNLTRSMVEALGDMVTGLMSGGKAKVGGQTVGVQDLHGVLAVIKIGADIAKQDWSQLLIFTVMISLDLAIINLVPWPALDGGHLAFMAFEAVRGRPMGERAQGEIVKWGFISLIVLMMVIMVNDVTALVNGKLDFKMRGKDGDKTETKTTTSTAAPDAKNGTGDKPVDTSAPSNDATPSTPAPAPAPAN